MTGADETYGLHWHGKRAARQQALAPATGTLKPCPQQSVDWDSTRNLVIEGDNLGVLKLLQASYAGKVKLISIDPPYNTGKDFVYPDSFQHSVKHYEALTRQAKGHEGSGRQAEAGGRYHTNWLNMIYPRLQLARDLLRPDGVIFITIDDHELAQLIQVCNEIFGEENRKGILIWQHSVQPKGYAGTFSVHHNYVLCYQRSDDFELCNTERTEEHNRSYANPDNDPRGPWRPGDVRNALYRPNLIYRISTPSGRTIEPPANGWRWSQQTLATKIERGEIVFSADETRIIRKIHLDTLDGRTPETILFGKDVGTTRDAAREIKTLFDGVLPFDTPKPTGLIRHLIAVSGARSDDIVLDFFAGSGTTAHAVMAHNCASGAKLRHILVQLPECLDVENKEQKSAAAYCLKIGIDTHIAALTRERLRRAAATLKAGLRARDTDLGFRAFRLDRSSLGACPAQPGDSAASLPDPAEHLAQGRSDDDIVFELVLRLGLDLCVPIQARLIAGKRVQGIAAGVLMACLDPHIQAAEVEPLAQGIVAWHKALAPGGRTTCVFRDSAFADDVAKARLLAILQGSGIVDVHCL